jgi:type VI secretion system secreted protein Hcp
MAVDYFLKLESVTGESTDQQHTGEIELASWSWGATNPPNIGSQTGGAGTGRVTMKHIDCTAQMSKASTALFEFCSQGKHFQTGTITCRKAGGTQQNFLVLTLTEVYIARYQTGQTHDSEMPLPYDHFTLTAAKMTFDYLAQTTQGTTASAGAKTYDWTKNQGS